MEKYSDSSDSMRPPLKFGGWLSCLMPGVDNNNNDNSSILTPFQPPGLELLLQDGEGDGILLVGLNPIEKKEYLLQYFHH